MDRGGGGRGEGHGKRKEKREEGRKGKRKRKCGERTNKDGERGIGRRKKQKTKMV